MPHLQYAQTFMTDTSNYPMPVPDASHHVDAGGKPAYTKRFNFVGKFHLPGLAPAYDESGWYHIKPDGNPAYPARFEKVWGFYCMRAAAKTQNRWTHITPDGTIAYSTNYTWVGNYQEGACAVQSGDGYVHIDIEGRPLYLERYAYVGDYRDGIAVAWVADTKKCRHILKDGRRLHELEYRYLGVFHKGLAKANDGDGWTHVRMSGEPAYNQRYKSVEDFYNGLALVETYTGNFIRIDEDGRTISTLTPHAAATGRKILITGNIGAGKSTLSRALSNATGWMTFGIDDARRIASDGSPQGEALAWAKFLEHAQTPGDTILEYTGCGPNRHLVNESLRRSGCQVLKVALKLPVKDCIRRIAQRSWDIPYPFAKLPDEALLQRIDQDLADEWQKRIHIPVSGEIPPDTNAQTIIEKIQLGLH